MGRSHHVAPETGQMWSQHIAPEAGGAWRRRDLKWREGWGMRAHSDPFTSPSPPTTRTQSALLPPCQGKECSEQTSRKWHWKLCNRGDASTLSSSGAITRQSCYIALEMGQYWGGARRRQD